MEAPDRELPLFPLNVVLFPTMILPLRIFEERYKEMIHACLESDSRFGVALIREGQEVGAPAVPHNMGTVAHIRRVTPLDERQRILDTPTAKERLALLTPILQREHQRNRARLEERIAPKGARLN